MQAPNDSPFSSSLFHLPSPDSDQDPLLATESQPSKSHMVTLPSSPSCIFTPTTTTTTTLTPSAQQLPTPRTPSNDDDDTTTISTIADNQLTPMIVPAKRGYKSHVPSACKFTLTSGNFDIFIQYPLFFFLRSIRRQLSQGSFGVRWYVLYL